MHTLPQLISDLALILGVAGITTLLFKRLKQPVVLGYIIAGLLVNPNFPLFPSINEVKGIQTWAEIGVIFLLFALGIEFSFKRLVQIGGSALITGIFEIGCMFGIGFITGRAFGWSDMDCIFLGGIISISSTTIIFRAFSELGLKGKQFTHLVIGILVIEDLVAVLLLVMLSTLAVSREFEGTEMLWSIAKLAFFLCLWFLMGIFLLPSFFKRMSKWINNETLLILSLGLCLGMVVLAEQVGFSAALGAFIMGSILAETTQAEKIEQLTSSVKDLFGAVFFVSVGMLINPYLLLEHIVPVLLLTVIVIAGKTLNVTLGALLSGKPLKQSIQAGTSMSQIGEFSFIIATLGLSLQVTSNYLYPIAVGVSVITTFSTPYMIRFAEPLYKFLEKKLPASWIKTLNRYSSGTQTIQAESDWKTVANVYMRNILFNAILLIAVIVFAGKVLMPAISSFIEQSVIAKAITSALSLIIMAPFLWALTAKKLRGVSYTNLWLDSKYNRGPLVMLEILRNVLAVVLFGFLLFELFNLTIALIGALVLMPVILIIFRRKLQRFYQRIELRFWSNLNEREEKHRKEQELSPWDAHLVTFEVSPHATFLGITLEHLKWREKFGVNIAFIERGNNVIYTPTRYERIYPFDRLGIIATDQQMQQLKPVLETTIDFIPTDDGKEAINLERIVVDEHTRLKGKTIRGSGVREKTNGLVVGIERKNERILNPPSDFIFEWDDIVLIVGDREKIRDLSRQDFNETAVQ